MHFPLASTLYLAAFSLLFTALLSMLCLASPIPDETALSTLSRSSNACHKCFAGKVCAGPSGNKKCVTPMQVGQSCGKDPFWICKRGLTCEHFVCRGKYVPQDGRCTRGGLRCRAGLACAGTAQVRKCVKPMGEGMKCKGDPYWVCKHGLVCRGGVCQKRAIPKDASCRWPAAVCAKGLVCAGKADNPRCVMPMKMGGKCKGDPYWVCEKGLKCVDGVCAKSW